MQVGNSDIAEIMGKLNYDWVAIDFEHGQINLSSLPIFSGSRVGRDTSICKNIKK